MSRYKICIIGLGSIGSQHILNLVEVLQKRNKDFIIDLLRSGYGAEPDGKLAKWIRNIYYDAKTMPNDYDIAFITNPTSLHYGTIADFAWKSRNMFIEKPVFSESSVDLSFLNLRPTGTYYVACPLRHTKVIQYLKGYIQSTKVYSARVICSSYLPEWRPFTDYRKSYSAKREQGGGVSIDLIHEWDYLYYLFGKPRSVLNIRGTFSDLEITSDDLSVYIAEYDHMLVEVHLDYFGRVPVREIELYGPEDRIKGDLIHNQIQFLKIGQVVEFEDSRRCYQMRELEYFFDILEGKAENHNDMTTALEVLKITEGRI